MLRKSNRFVISLIVSGGIHLIVFFLLIYTIPPSLLVQELPGSIEVSLEAGRGSLRKQPSTTMRESAALQQEIKDRNNVSKEDRPDGGNQDRRGNSALAVPHYGRNQKPPYPEAARRRSHEGTVRLEVEVLTNGKVGGIKVKESSGYVELDQSALQAVREWSFIPARFAGMPVKATVIVPITFQLRDRLAAEIR